jgi:hypothetical protein
LPDSFFHSATLVHDLLTSWEAAEAEIVVEPQRMFVIVHNAVGHSDHLVVLKLNVSQEFRFQGTTDQTFAVLAVGVGFDN